MKIIDKKFSKKAIEDTYHNLISHYSFAKKASESNENDGHMEAAEFYRELAEINEILIEKLNEISSRRTVLK